MTLVSGTINAVMFLSLKSGVCYFFLGRRKISSAEHPCPNLCRVPPPPPWDGCEGLLIIYVHVQSCMVVHSSA